MKVDPLKVHPLNVQGDRVAPGAGRRQIGMRKIFAAIGSIAASSLFGWAGSGFGIMTSFMLGMVGTGIGMYAGYKLADRLEV